MSASEKGGSITGAGGNAALAMADSTNVNTMQNATASIAGSKNIQLVKAVPDACDYQIGDQLESSAGFAGNNEADKGEDKVGELPGEHTRLARLLSRRSSKMELQLRNIIRIQSNDEVSTLPGLEGVATPFYERKKILKSCLKRRLSKQELVDKNILRGGPVPGVEANVGRGERRVSISASIDPSIAGVAEQLRKAQLTDTLNSHLLRRPSRAEIPERILMFDENVEVASTFKKSHYDRKPDQDATYRRLTPRLKQEIRAELNDFKRNEMMVHDESQQYTTFH